MTQNLVEKKQELIRQRDELMKRLEAIKSDYAAGLSPDFEEQAVQLENADVLAEISRITLEELQKVNQAIERLEKEIGRA